ncbi:hypothetical protein GAPWKB11_1972 [Gilliamella apicola]|nr:hypothetical protein GAPWKB11_1972 [Gilliamella apicola]
MNNGTGLGMMVVLIFLFGIIGCSAHGDKKLNKINVFPD